ncbi:PTS sugar transporter subunit IIC [Listeria sp. SHR_NRA_18]|uniref:PTS sugar transporter subunit IIC n=1 Tax=Listeria TaxID=1637 RepID=UPI00051D0BFD|nr:MULTISPECIES: PTS transporter subunit EIIC [Listeria]KGL41352.1 PTS cellobiose transporter subunit IIC [Listeriaceae bacterium FSL A5-0209]KMT62385.1 Lichenan permease IIC component [Listeria newyorkensis]RQW67299.1 PTS sugar transporter subunit IIC [Listeria sp. SHR_NRA_18]
MKKFVEKLGWVSQKLGNQIHLKSMRDAFATILPFIMLAGFMVLINNVIIKPDGFMSNVISSATLTTWQELGNSIVNGTLGIITILIGASVSYFLAQNRRFENPFAPALQTIALIIIFIPLATEVIPLGATKAVEVAGVIPTALTGSAGMFVGIVTALLSTELFIYFSKSEKLKIKISGESVPPAVIKSFNVLIPTMLTVLVFAFVSFLLTQLFALNIYALIGTIIQKPLTFLVTSVPGFLALMTISQMLYSIGIAGSGILGPIMDPVLLANMQDNMTAYASHAAIPHIINTTFRDIFGVMGGGGNTIALLIAIFIWSKRKDYREIAALSSAPGLFNINEPVVFGLPIVYNLSLMIPFIISTPLCLLLAYIATKINMISEVVVMVPWTTPVVASGFLATGGDWRAAVFQIFLVGVCVLLYLPFLKVNDRIKV